MCCLEFIVKYVLIIGNIIFALLGLGILGLGIAVHVNLKDIYQLIPVGLSALSISIITLGCIIFVISTLACCGAIRESRCMLLFYALFMAILAGIKIYLTVLIFGFLDTATTTVTRWLISAFNNEDLRPAYHGLETLFRCCGTTGAGSYAPGAVPQSCCASPIDNVCQANFYDGCIDQLTSYFETFGESIGAVLIVVIIIECVCVLAGLFLSCQIRRKRYTA
ncbi:tetraspanin-9-like [Trichoplusia ni]|uniref:Tetraspanin n=1 Tax=Trichoplusia ni TaxID=7111 RepID=A0A7E5WGE7_TRINI|nr:tetraspanin-9-like [Trichoplusia ni]